MFSWEVKKGGTRFTVILLVSVLLHAGLVGGLAAGYAYRTALMFGTFRWDDDPNAVNTIQVAKASKSKPLVLPPGFYAQKDVKPLPERKPTEPKPRPAPPSEVKKKKTVEEEPKVDRAATTQMPPVPVPSGPPQFGTIKENPLKVHLKAIYLEYEKGNLPEEPYRVTVTCKVQNDGSLSDIKIVKSSGSDLIDKTALNLFGEISAMRALQPLSVLSSLSLTLEKGATQSTISAVGFSNDQAQVNTLLTMLSTVKMFAQYNVKNADQAALLQQLKVSQTGSRVSVSIGLPNSRAGEMMRKSFGSKTPAPVASKATA
jgi:TonB family protein